MDYIIERCTPHSMISIERFMANIQATEYIHKEQITGDIVEIGVWKGGSILSMILANQELNKNTSRTFHLYDTFSGMTEPTDIDCDASNNCDAKEILSKNDFFRCICPYDDVKQRIDSLTTYPKDLIHYHVGDICKTNDIPEKIALLRLDTDWYESTKYELEHFYPHVSPGGVVIIDDYGHWTGCRLAVDEFLVKYPSIKLHYIDYTGIMFYKPLN